MQFSKKALAVAIVAVVGVSSPGSASALHAVVGDGAGDLRRGLANETTVDGQPQVKYSQGGEEEQGRQHTSPPHGKLRGGTLRQSTPKGKKEEQRNDNLVHFEDVQPALSQEHGSVDVSSGSIFRDGISSVRKPGYEVRTMWNGDSGTVKGMQGPALGGFYACGAQIRFESPQGTAGDDTGADGLKMKFCHLSSWGQQQDVTVYEGYVGSWKGMVMCPRDEYIEGASVRYEDHIGVGDDTALNGLRIRCRRKDTHKSTDKTIYDGEWGDWKPWVTVGDKFISAAEVRFEDHIGVGDDTAMNGLFFEYETPNNGLSTARIVGTWDLSGSGPNIAIEKTASMTWTNHQESTTETTSALTTSVSAGFDFEMFSSSAEISGTSATLVGTGMGVSFGLTEDQTFSVKCPQNDERMLLWKWHMHQEANDIGPGFESKTYHYICTALNLSPKCPLLDCTDTECQTCISGTTALVGDSRSVQDIRVLDY